MSLTAGSRLGPYAIVDRLGAGGMGEVYRAQDTRLGRIVAIKVLPAVLASDPEARHRLKREARVLSQLTHPQVCALYDVGEEGDALYLVMELIDGQTLAERLARGPLPPADVLELGAQIAAALGHAHRNGIAHRDLKPGNIMLTSSGVKLLDFGLARIVAPAMHGVTPDGSTFQADVTSAGAVMGTFPYMAPEQIEGRPADFRSDIFALGAVLFQMATGRRAFAGDTTPGVVGSILSSTPPPVSTLQPAAPPALDHLVTICLEKDPDKRWQSAHDVAVMLRTLSIDPGASAFRGNKPLQWLPWAFAVIAGALSIGLWLRPAPAAPAAAAHVTFTVPPPAGGRFFSWVESTEMALSPDGTRLAFIASNGGVWIRPLGSLTATPVSGAEGANSAFWSPDGRRIAFFGGGMLKWIEASGGAAVPLSSVTAWTGHTGSWGKDSIVFAPISGTAIYRVSTAGGQAVELIKRDAARHEGRLVWPHFLPDGIRFLYVAWRDDQLAGRLMLWAPDRPPREIMPVLSNVEYVEPGYLLFARDGTLLAQPFDAATATLSGDPVAVAQPVEYALIPGVAHFTTSRNGVVAYQAHSDRSRVAWFDGTGRETAVAMRTGKHLNLRLSPDGRQLVVDRTAPGQGSYDLWTLDVERGVETRVTSDPGNEVKAMWTPDRSTLVYSAGPNGPPQVVIRNLANGAERALDSQPGFQMAEDIAPDGSVLYRQRSGAGGSFRLLLAPLTGGQAAAVLDPRHNYSGARFSPEGKWLAYTSTESGSPEVYVVRWPIAQERLRVSVSGGRQPRWSPDGRALLYVSDAGLMRVPMTSGQPGKTALLFERQRIGMWMDFDVTRDNRFAAIVAETFGADEPLTVVVNWRSRLP